MQNWMAAKMELGKRHGFTKSGAHRPMGDVWDDVNIGRNPDVKVHPIKTRHVERHGNRIVEVTPVKRDIKSTIAVVHSDRPVAWGKGRKAQRRAAHHAATPHPMAQS